MSDITKVVKSLQDLDQCPPIPVSQDGVPQLPPDSRMLMVTGNPKDKDTYTAKYVDMEDYDQLAALKKSGTQVWSPSKDDYIDLFVNGDRPKALQDYKYVCRIGRKGGLLASKYPLLSEDFFQSCDKQGSAMREMLPVPLSPDVAKYLKSKYAQDAGCTSLVGDAIYYNLLTKPSQNQVAIDSIKKDIAEGKFQPGVDEKIAKNIIDALETMIETRDPITVGEKSKQEQFDEMRSNMWMQLGFSGILQGATTALFGYFFHKQIKMSAKMMEQNQEIMSEKFGNGTALEKYGVDLVEEAKAGRLEPVNMDLRVREIKQAVMALSRGKSVAILGKSGVGKTAFVEGLATMIAKGMIPALKGAKIFMIEMADIVAGTSYRGQFEQRMRALVKDAAERLAKGEKIIVFFDEFHTVMGAGGTGRENPMDASNILKPALARKKMLVIGATTKDESRFIKRDKAMARRLIDVDLPEFTPEQTVEAIKTCAQSCGAEIPGVNPKIQVMDDAFREIVRLAPEFKPDTAYPANAGELLEQAIAHKRDIDPSATTLTLNDVKTAFDELKNGGGGEEGTIDTSDQAGAATRAGQAKMINDFIVRQPAFMGEDPQILLKLAETAYDKLSLMTTDEREQVVGDPKQFVEQLKMWRNELTGDSKPIPAPEKKPRASRRRGGGEPPAPPAAPAGDGGGTPTPAPDGDASGTQHSTVVVPWTSVTPSPANVDAASRMPIGAMIPDVGAVLDRIPQIVPSRLVTPEGIVMNVMMDPPAAIEMTASPGVRGSATLPRGAQVSLDGSAMFAPSAALGVAGGVGGLVATEGLAVLLGRQLKWYEEFGAFVGAGTGISAAHAAAGGAAITAGGMLASLAHGLPSCLITFGATGKYLTDAGFKESGRAHKYTTVVAGSVLAAATTSAQLAAGSATVAELGLTTIGLAAGIGASLGVGAALITGGAAGHWGDKWAAKKTGIVNADGDTSISGWWADKAADLTPRSAQVMIHDFASAWF